MSRRCLTTGRIRRRWWHRISGNAAVAQGRIVERWFRRDPMAASRWAATLTREQGRASLVRTLNNQWRQQGFGDAVERLREAGFADEEIPQQR